MNSATLQTPRPLPMFASEQSFTQRKKTPFQSPRPPKPPAKSCPPVSRIFLTPNAAVQPQLVSFKPQVQEPNKEKINSPLYNQSSHQLYFEQCFEIMEKLGAGAFGEVYKVKSKEDGKIYAVKRSSQRFRGEWDRRNRLAEVEKHERLPAHPNCVHFVKAWEERGHLYIQTELCKMSLAEYADIQHGRVAESLIWSFLIDLTKSVKHLHDHHLCHFDIKPANIFVAQDGVTCKMGDFGLVVSEDQLGGSDVQEGDPKYMSPELIHGQFGKAADIFSLGISLLEVACDMELPSGGDSWHQLRSGYLPDQFVSYLSGDLLGVLRWMVHPQPAMRPTADQLLTHPSVCKMMSQRKYHICYHTMAKVVSRFCHQVWSGLVLLVMLLASLFHSNRGRVVLTPPRPGSRQHNSQRRQGVSPRVTAADTSFSDTEEDPNDSFSDDHKETLNKSWLNDSPIKFHSPLYAGPPIPLSFGDLEEQDTLTEYGTKPLGSSPSSKADTCSPGGGEGSDHMFTPASVPSIDQVYSHKPGSIGPRNLMNVFAEAAND